MLYFLLGRSLDWLPAPLALTVVALVTFFFIFGMFYLVRFIIDILKFVLEIFGGLLKKVVAWFLG